jgi:hypothetical protein
MLYSIKDIFKQATTDHCKYSERLFDRRIYFRVNYWMGTYCLLLEAFMSSF